MPHSDISEIDREGQGFLINRENHHVLGIFNKGLWGKDLDGWFAVDRTVQWWEQKLPITPDIRPRKDISSKDLYAYIDQKKQEGFEYYGYSYPKK